jgi:hypothetical protein
MDEGDEEGDLDEIRWSNDRGDEDRTENPAIIAHVEAQRMSVGAAYRTLQFLPDFIVLWQIRRRGMALGLLALYAATIVAVVVAAITQIAVVIGGALLLALLATLASWFVIFGLEDWAEEYNRSVDEELRRLMGR